MLDREGTEEVHLYEAGLSPLRVEVINGLLNRAADGAHRDDHLFGVRRSVVVEEVIFAAGYRAYLLHIIFHNAGQRVIEAVVGLAHLEVNVGILHGAAHHRALGVERGGAEFGEGLPVEQRFKRLVGHLLHLVYLMGGAETVKKVHEGDTRLYRRKVRDAAEIHYLLHTARRKHRKPALAAVHHVGMVAEDRKGMGADGTRRDVEHAGVALPRKPVKHGDHQHQPLR